MYHAITRARIRSLWRRIGTGDYRVAVSMAVPDLRFRFVGDTPLGAELHSREDFARWFAAVFDRLPGIRFAVTDVVVKGWPWNTTAVIRLDIAATLADGTAYRNEGVQWLRLRWGRMVSDEVIEDTKALDEACRVQAEHAGTSVGVIGRD